MSSGLTKKDIKIIIQGLEKYPEVETAVLYGSRAMGTYQRGSDIDIALKGGKLTSSICSHIHFELEEETLLPYFFDITDYQSIKNEKLKEHIDRVGKVIYGIDTGKLKEDNSKLPKEWIKTTLGGMATFQRGFDLPKKDRLIGKYPLMVSNGQDGTHKEFKVKAPGIVTGRSGTLGQVYYIKDDFWPLNTTLWIKDFHENDVKFVYYFLKEIPFERYNAGSGVPTLNRNHIHPISINIPPLLEQKAIAGVLSSLDAKIDLLQKQNQTLEKIAQTLFKQWFVDFNFPDEKGKPYKDNGGEMVDSELGEIPCGWTVKGFLESFLLMSGGTPKTSIAEYWNGDINWISAKDITVNHKQFIFDTEKKITKDGLNNSATKLLPKHTIIISARGTVGNYCIIPKKMCISQSNYGIKAKKEGIHFYSYLVVSNIIDLLKAQAYGSVFDTITTRIFKSLPVVKPPGKIVAQFEDTVDAFFNRILLNTNQIQTLTKTRDTLLPKLMSGQIRVNN